jgi:hypothetical protein
VITGIMLNRALSKIKAQGEPLRVTDMVAKLPPGAPNAATVYQQAFDSLRLSEEEKAQDMEDPEVLSSHLPLARTMIAANTDYFRLLEEASRISACSFSVNWEDPLNALFPHYAKMRQAARLLVIRSKLSLMEGRVDAAAEDCATIFRIAEHAGREPVLISCLVGHAIQKTGLQQLEEVLSAGNPDQVVCRQLLQQLSAIDNRARLSRAMLAERAWARTLFTIALRRPADLAGMIEPKSPRRIVLLLRVYSTLGRPLMNLDELAYLRAMDQVIAAAALSYPESERRVQAAGDAIKNLPRYRSLLSYMVMPVFTRSVQSSEVAAAATGAGGIALHLVLYQYQHGRYPASLEVLTQAGEKLPLDPFTQKPYHYRTEGSGFVVWSVGPDLADNRGAEPEGRHRWSVPRPEGDEPPSDLAFRVKQ